MALPETMRGVLVDGPSSGSLRTDLPVPQPLPGTAVIRVLHNLLHNNAQNIYRASSLVHPMAQPWPCIPGGYAVGRVAAPGPDAAKLREGQLVVIEPFVRARDDDAVAILWGAFDGLDDRARRLYRDNWRHACWAQFVRAPLENAWPVDEARISALGLRTRDLAHVGPLAVAYAALRRVDLVAGETLLVAPATGIFSGGAVHVARAMGVRVIAASRNGDGLARLREQYPGVETVRLAGDAAADTAALGAAGPVDVFLDISPGAATGSAHLGAGVMAVRPGGRVCLAGGRGDEALPIPYGVMILRNLTVRGSWMYEREHVRTLVKMVEAGTLRLDKEAGMEVTREFDLADFEEGLEAGLGCSAGNIMVMNP